MKIFVFGAGANGRACRAYIEHHKNDEFAGLHDYFHPELPGVKQAVSEFEKERGIKLRKVPIGDFCSIAIL